MHLNCATAQSSFKYSKVLLFIKIINKIGNTLKIYF